MMRFERPRAGGDERGPSMFAGLGGAPTFRSARGEAGAPTPPPEQGRAIDPVAMIDRLGVPMFTLDVLSRAPLDVVFSGFNEAQAEAAGVVSSAVIGLRPRDFLPPRQAANVMANFRECIEVRAPVSYDEAHRILGEEHWYRTTLSPWMDEAGEVATIVGSAVQVTDFHRRADEDASTIAALKRLTDEMRTFSAMAAHDVRSPLSTIEMLVKVIADSFVDHGDRKLPMIQACGETARNAREQMDELLRHANALGVVQAPAQRCDLARIGAEISALIDPDGRLDITWPEAVVHADAVALQLILRNLATNATRHCGGRVTIDVDEAGGGGPLAFTVADDGPGFPDGVDPFEDDGALVRDRSARGFGLQAVRSLVEARGGRVGVVRDHPLGGAAVRFTLPCRVIDESAPFSSDRASG